LVDLPPGLLTLRDDHAGNLAAAVEIYGNSQAKFAGLTFDLQNAAKGEANRVVAKLLKGGGAEFELNFPGAVDVKDDKGRYLITRAGAEEAQAVAKLASSGEAHLRLIARNGFVEGTGGRVAFTGIKGQYDDGYALIKADQLTGEWAMKLKR